MPLEGDTGLLKRVITLKATSFPWGHPTRHAPGAGGFPARLPEPSTTSSASLHELPLACALLLGKGLTIWVLRVTEPPPFLLGEGFVRAHWCVCG